jgi:hypothetical protein
VSTEDEYEYKHLALLGLFSILQIIILKVVFLPTSTINDQHFNTLAGTEDYLKHENKYNSEYITYKYEGIEIKKRKE